MNHKPLVSTILLGVLGAVVALSPVSARPTSDEVLSARSGQIRLETDDIFTSDGTGVYRTPGDLEAFLYDHRDADSADGGTHDYLHFRPKKESYALSSPLVDGDPGTEGAQPVPCAYEVIQFWSRAERNWIEALPPGGNLEGYVLATCYTNLDDRTGSASGYVVQYLHPFGGGDCGVVSRDALDPKKYSVDAPGAEFIGSVHVSGCGAVTHAFERRRTEEGYSWDYRFLGTTSSPLNVAITLQKSV